jgi:hypothetical protein
MFKKIFSITLLLYSVLGLKQVANAQSVTVEKLYRPVSPIVIDGKLNDWGDTLR